MFNTPYEIAQFIIGILGALTTVLCFLPQGIKTFLTKNTAGLSKWFFICALASSVFWLTLGSMAIASPYVFGGDSVSIANGLSAGIPPIITNVITIIINAGILIIKLKNMKQAKLLGISETEYCSRLATHSKAHNL